MKDNLQHLFRDRFQGHEAPVDPGAWQAIQGQLAAAAPAADGLNDLFRDRFSGHEMEVDPSVWQAVSSQLGHTAAAGAGTSASVWGWVAAATGAVVITTAALLWTNDEPAKMTASVPQGQVIEGSAQVQEEQKDGNSETAGPSATAALTPERTGTVGTRAEEVALVNGPTMEEGSRPGSEVNLSTAKEQHASKEAEPRSVPEPEVVDGTDKVERIIQALAEEAKVETPQPKEHVVSDATVPEPEELLAVDASRSDLEMPKLFIPNVFTPNNDGVNDTFKVEGDGFARVLVKVFAMKNNQLVFSTSTGEAWTGANCEDGIYLVAVEAVTHDGRSMTEGKVVWLNPPITR